MYVISVVFVESKGVPWREREGDRGGSINCVASTNIIESL